MSKSFGHDMVHCKAITEAEPIDAINIPSNTLNTHVSVDLCNTMSNNF